MGHTKNKSLELKETADYASMRRLALRSGLEDGEYSDFVKAYGFYDGDELVACAGLRQRGSAFSLECIAVSQELRCRGLGSELVATVEEEARRRGAKELWALARAPVFFEKIGYDRMTDAVPDGPSLTACRTCRQYLRSCNPSIVMKML